MVYIPAIYCHDFYAEEIKAEQEAGDENGFFSLQFDSDSTKFKICPDTPSLNITGSASINMQILSCM